jgi:phosphohistidine phosphatase
MPGPYEIYLIRHGVAEERGEKWPDDSKRPLTDDGMSRLRKSIRGLSRLGVSFDVVLTSSLVRAKQTAEIAAGGVSPRPSIVTVDSLAPDGTFAAVVADLEKHAKKTRIALVGHEPNIGEIAARLIGSRHAIEFKKGAVCRIDLATLPPSGPGDLRWLLTPRIMRAIKK